MAADGDWRVEVSGLTGAFDDGDTVFETAAELFCAVLIPNVIPCGLLWRI